MSSPPETLFAAALAYHDQSRLEEAEAAYLRLLVGHPDHAAGLHNLAMLHCQRNNPRAGLPLFERLCRLQPMSPGHHANLGNAYYIAGSLESAEQCYRRSLQLGGESPDGLYNLGNALKGQGRHEEALACYARAVALQPDHHEAYNNLGHVLHDMGRRFAAVRCFQRAAVIRPDDFKAHFNLGMALGGIGQLEAARACYGKAIQLKPEFLDAHHTLLFLYNLLDTVPPQVSLEQACAFGAMVAARASPFNGWLCEPVPDKRLRIGLVSGDFRVHPVGFFLEGLLSELASAPIELIAYANNTYDDELTARIKPRFAAWHSIAGMEDADLARRIHGDGVDILVDLAGHTRDNRLPVFAWKPAPVQVTWLGYFATTGVRGIDYILADPHVLPVKEESHFTELAWRLPEIYYCFTPPDIAIEPGPLPARGSGHVTFGCFNKLSKLNDDVVALWASVLRRVPGSRLLLKAAEMGEAEAARHLTARFAAQGIDEARLSIEGHSPRAEYLAAYRRVDMALDPFPFPGGTTTVEGLWMGVPVVTMRGKRFIGHQGETILNNAGLSEWIARDEDEYVAKAVAHAANLDGLTDLRARLRRQLLASPVCDTPRFAMHFLAALRGMWQDWCSRAQRMDAS